MASCISCGEELAAGGRFCAGCGKPVASPQQSSAPSADDSENGSSGPAYVLERWPIQLWHWSAAEVRVRQNRNVLITNSPALLGLFYGVRTAGNSFMRRKAARQVQPQWRPLGDGVASLDRVSINLTGPWDPIYIPFDQIRNWQKEPTGVTITQFSDLDPLFVSSPGIEQFAQRLSELSQGMLWHEPVPETWPTPQEEPIGWEHGDGRFSFAVRRGWQRYMDPGYLQKAHSDFAAAGQQLLLVLRYDTMDCDAFLEISEVRAPDLLKTFAEDPSFIERNAFPLSLVRAKKSNGAVSASPRLVLVGTERASLLSFTTNVPGFRARNAELWVPHRGTYFVVGYNVTDIGDPTPKFERTLPDLQAMVASWQWRY